MKIAAKDKGTNVAGSLVVAHHKERILARDAMFAVITSLHYLCKQGLAIRGSDEANSTFTCLLNLRSMDNAALKSRISRAGYKWLSPAIQNELISDMAQSVLRSYVNEIIDAKLFALVMDESTDVSVKEQISVCFQYVSSDLEVHETLLVSMKHHLLTLGLCFQL